MFHQNLTAIDDIDSWRQVSAIFVHRFAQEIVYGWFCICIGRYCMDGGIATAQFLQFIEGAERLVVVVVPQAAIEPRFDDDGVGVPRCSAIAVLFGEPPIETVSIVVLEELSD